MSKVEIRATVKAETKATMDAYAKRKGVSLGEALDAWAALVGDPLAAFAAAQKLLEQFATIDAEREARFRAVEDQIRVIADFVADATRDERGTE